jgi:3-oxoacyl-(acyl-carrier-protein) synthase
MLQEKVNLKKSKVYITGMGIISPIGLTLEENHQSLIAGKCGISHVELFSTKYASQFPFGEIKISNEDLQEKLNANERGTTRTTLLSLQAFQEAIRDAQLDNNKVSSSDTALIGANTVGGMCLTDELYQDANRKSNGSEFLGSYDFGSVNIYLQQRYSINGIVNTINTACSSSANAIMYGARLIQNGFATRAIAGGADALAKFTINGFNSLNILSAKPCAPFDKNRNGLNLGEGAAFLVLENEAAAKGKKIYAELSGFANTNDAYHPSSLSDNGDGPFLSMKRALENANLQTQQIDFINAHGTGTENNDLVESRAMLKLFQKPPAFASTKSNTGHTLGAAGALEAVYSILNIAHQEICPSLHFQEAIDETGLIPVLKNDKKQINHVMSNSFGFGGNCTSLIFSKVK